jgi:predicted GNAT family acetyltransferase
MTDTPPALEIRHDIAQGRFAAAIGAREAVADYRRTGETLQIVHTEVPPEFQGRGIAAALIAELLAYAGAHGFMVMPICSYARTYMRRHPETRTLLAPGAVL